MASSSFGVCPLAAFWTSGQIGPAVAAPLPISGAPSPYMRCLRWDLNGGLRSGGPFASQPFFTRFGAGSGTINDYGYSGNYKIAGFCLLNGVALPRMAVLLSPMNSPGLVLRGVFSDDTTGAFLFSNLAQGTYIVDAYDPNGTYDGVTHENVTAVLQS